MIDFMPLLFYQQGKDHHYPLFWMMAWPQIQSGCREVKKSVLLLLGIKHEFFHHLSCDIVAIPSYPASVKT
jgi:hypothetical protein